MLEERNVLFVDDEINILHALKRLLRKENYQCIIANNASEAISILEKEMIHVVISDQRMPDMTGVALLEKVKAISPYSIRVILSGYAEVVSIVEAINKGQVYRFLAKPWNDEELKTNIRQCLEYYNITNLNRELLKRISIQNQELQQMNNDLEQMVEMRTFTLKMSQDVLEALPFSLIGVDMDKRLIITNEMARIQFPILSQVIPGENIDKILPEEIIKLTQDCFEGRLCKKVRILWENQNVTFQAKIIKSSGILRGGILTLSPGEKEEVC